MSSLCFGVYCFICIWELSILIITLSLFDGIVHHKIYRVQEVHILQRYIIFYEYINLMYTTHFLLIEAR